METSSIQTDDESHVWQWSRTKHPKTRKAEKVVSKTTNETTEQGITQKIIKPHSKTRTNVFALLTNRREVRERREQTKQRNKKLQDKGGQRAEQKTPRSGQQPLGNFVCPTH